MRRILALILLLTLLCSLFGCRKPNSLTTEPSSNSNEGNSVYHAAELLGYQAHLLSRQLGLSVSDAYLKNAGASADLINTAKAFTASATGQPNLVKFINKTDRQFLTSVQLVTETVNGADLASLSKLLAFETRFYSPVPVENCITVYLRYSEQCHILVHFTPSDSNFVTAQVYPLYRDSASLIVNKYFSKAKTYDGDDFQELIAKVEQVDVTADLTGQTVNAEYYAQLAKNTFSGVKALTQAQLASYAVNSALVANLGAYSKALASGIGAVKVYDASEVIRLEANKRFPLDDSAALENWALAKAAAALPNSYCAAFDQLTCTTNDILADVLNISVPGAVAQAGEKAALVVMEISNNFSVIVCIYPNANNIYEISFACIPASFSKTQDMVLQSGATFMK